MADIPTPTDVQIMAVRAGISMTKACSRAGLSPQVFQRWKAGRGSPSIKSVTKLLNALDAAIAEKEGAAA